RNQALRPLSCRAYDSLHNERTGREMVKITAAVVEEKSAPFVLRELELEPPRSDEVLVRIVATGICQSDLHVRDQEYPVPLPAERNVVKVPRDVPLELLGPLGCGLQTGAGAVLNSLKVPARASLAVFGTGAVGLAAIMAAKVAGAHPIVAVDINPKRLELA